MRRRTLTHALLAAAVAAAVPVRALALEGPAAWICTEGLISEIFVDNKSVFDVGDPSLDSRFNWAYRLANRMHVRTRETVIRRELLFRVGDCYDPEMLEDSERILRNSSFIADADVFGVKQPDGSYHVVVETRDEWSTRVEPQLESGSELAGVEVREDNLFGRGQRVRAFVGEEYDETVYGGAVGTRQFLGTQLDADLSVERTPLGTGFSQRLAYPFRGESGRWAVRQQVEQQERYFEYLLPEEGRLRPYLFPVRRRSFDAGVVARLGRRGNLTLFGLGLSGESVVYPNRGLLIPRDGEAPGPLVPDSGVVGLDSIGNVRLVFLAGQRNVRFDRRRALDAVRGVEDVVLGTEVEVAVGRSLPGFSDEDDVALDLGVFAAGVAGPVLAGSRVVVSGQRDFAAPADSSEWRNVFAQLDAWAYYRPTPESRHTLVAAFSGSAGWNATVPFQLTLGSRAGVRGLRRHVYAGERRAVVSLEGRSYWGWPFPQLFDLGSAVFVDVGRSWAGDDRFGEDSPLEASAGFGLRLAFPPGSRQTYRIDVATPVTGAAFRDFRVSLGVGQAVGRGATREDPQLRRSSRRGVSASVFSFP